MAGKGGGGSWKVAYADFVTAMMALFMVLWITAQDQKVKEAIEHTFKHPFNPLKSAGIIPNTHERFAPLANSTEGGGQGPSEVEMQALQRLNADLLKILQTSPELANNNTVMLDITPQGLHISVLDRAQKPIFDRQSAQLTEYGAWVFSTLAWEIARYKNFGLEVEGHTRRGEIAARADYDLWELTVDRANTARRHLVDHGVNVAQISKVVGFSDTVPMRNTIPEDETNNRVTLLLTGRTSEPLQLSMHHE